MSGHATEAPSEQYLSRGQRVHAAPFAPLYPSWHVQLVLAEERTGEAACAGHALLTPPEHHDPAAHAAHVPPFAPKYPATHTHDVSSWLPCQFRVYLGCRV